jgi:hypothetical protein
LQLGAAADGSSAFAGDLDELRITPALVYHEDFTPQRRYGATESGLLFHFDECQGPLATDAETHAKLQFEGMARWIR